MLYACGSVTLADFLKVSIYEPAKVGIYFTTIKSVACENLELTVSSGY